MTDLSFLTFNIGNPSAERAERQLAWLASRDEHVLVLTETKASAGCQLLADAFRAAGWVTAFPAPDGDYGTMIVSRIPAEPIPFGDRIGYLPARAAAMTLDLPGGPLLVAGLYVPSPRRQPGQDRTQTPLAGSMRDRDRRRPADGAARRPQHPRTRPSAALPVLRPVRVVNGEVELAADGREGSSPKCNQ